jgi:hypothetical protein
MKEKSDEIRERHRRDAGEAGDPAGTGRALSERRTCRARSGD